MDNMTEPKKGSKWWQSVRSMIALAMTFGFIAGFHRGLIDAGMFSDIFKTIVIFYFVKKALETK